MVKKSLFARLFGRSDANGGSASRRSTAVAEKPPKRSVGKQLEERGAVKPENLRPNRMKADAAPSARPVEVVKPDGKKPEAKPESVTRTETAAPQPEQPKPANGPPIRASQMPRDEEISLKLKEGFQGISSVLSGIDRKMDRQQQTSSELMVTVRKIPEMMKDVPDASKAGLELLATISTILEGQGQATNELLTRMADLPQSVEALEERLQAQVETMSQTGVEAEKAARETQRQVSQAFTKVSSRVDSISTDQARTQEEMLRALRRQSAQQDRRVDELIKRSSSSTKIVIFLMIVVIAALLLVVQQVANG